MRTPPVAFAHIIRSLVELTRATARSPQREIEIMGILKHDNVIKLCAPQIPRPRAAETQPSSPPRRCPALVCAP
eukprot:2679865-Prymnesium_polylepis.1